MVTINGYAKDTCVLCDKDTDCFDADFGKLKGPLCRGCLTRLVKNRSARKALPARQESAPAPNGQAVVPTK